jgi:hypothetical protein
MDDSRTFDGTKPLSKNNMAEEMLGTV